MCAMSTMSFASTLWAISARCAKSMVRGICRSAAYDERGALGARHALELVVIDGLGFKAEPVRDEAVQGA